jgi:formylglycine-generating enzyme required for sulfatase activity
LLIDFTQIKSGEEFELLCEDLLRAMGFAIEAKVARGSDLGKDIIATRTLTDLVGFSEVHRYLVECKHYAKSGKSVREPDIGSPIARMGTHNCDRYILATTTVPAEKTRVQLAGITNIVSTHQATAWHAGDLVRFLETYPNVRNRYFPSASGSTPADELAATIVELLKVMGFACQDHQAAGDRVRLVCTHGGAFARPVAVVCKEGPVSRGDVEAVLGNVNAQSLGGGVIVTHKLVTSSARQRAAETGSLVRAFTLDQFYRELIDFEPYVCELVADYEEDELSTYYVGLGCRIRDGSVYKPMDDYVDTWLGDPTRNHISILGDYGTGKTSFCRQYAAKLGRRWLENPDRYRIPVLISLRDYAKAMSLQQLITDFLVNRCKIQASYEAFVRFNADGKLVLLFDGFDEMAQKVDYQTKEDNFEELARAVEDRGKVIFTCRTSYFRTQEEAEKIISYRMAEPLVDGFDPTERSVTTLPERPNFEIVHLLPLDREDIRAMLRARFPRTWEEYWGRIERTYDLAKLAQRPVLLDMIACSLPQLKPGQAANAAQLYGAYTDLWLARDEEGGRTFITSDDKRLFMQELALEMLRRDQSSIHYSQLSEQVSRHFQLDKADEIDYFEHDVRTCSFLNRDTKGNYRFAHKSFQEFFVAQWLAPKLLDGSAPEMRINEEIRGFVHGLLANVDWPPPPPEGVEVTEGMVWVPAGPFIMGGEYGFSVQVACIEQDFFIARTPVTNAEYARFVMATGHRPPRHWGGDTPPEQLRDHPVVHVSWHDAVAYADWAGMRLLTEQEWEKAARGIDGRVYPWGDPFDPGRCNSSESDIDTTTPVGRYSPEFNPELVEGGDSPCGCTDMAGNVWEWTRSKWRPSDKPRVLRGAAFVNAARNVRCVTRLRRDPTYRYKLGGFRVGMTAPLVAGTTETLNTDEDTAG